MYLCPTNCSWFWQQKSVASVNLWGCATAQCTTEVLFLHSYTLAFWLSLRIPGLRPLKRGRKRTKHSPPPPRCRSHVHTMDLYKIPSTHLGAIVPQLSDKKPCCDPHMHKYKLSNGLPQDDLNFACKISNILLVPCRLKGISSCLFLLAECCWGQNWTTLY